MKKVLMPKDVSKIIDLLRKQDSYASYELSLLKSCEAWLKNFQRRKYS